MPLSKTMLEQPTTGPDGSETLGLMVNHILTDWPLETHVFVSLLMHVPVYVGTKIGVWRVDGDKISLISDRASEGER